MKMSKFFASLLLGLLVLSAGNAVAQQPTGNGAVSGPRYTLNIIGHTTCPTNDFKDSNRHVIAVLLNYDDGSQNGSDPGTLNKTNKIFLTPGDFQVRDGNACDGDGALFALPPNPFTCTEQDLADGLCDDPTFQEYWVYARALGSPKDNPYATITTCATDPDTGLIVCSSENTVLVRDKNKPSFHNYTKELTTIVGTVDGSLQRIGIFDPALEDYFWDYDNNGLRLAQLWFIPIPD